MLEFIVIVVSIAIISVILTFTISRFKKPCKKKSLNSEKLVTISNEAMMMVDQNIARLEEEYWKNVWTIGQKLARERLKLTDTQSVNIEVEDIMLMEMLGVKHE